MGKYMSAACVFQNKGGTVHDIEAAGDPEFVHADGPAVVLQNPGAAVPLPGTTTSTGAAARPPAAERKFHRVGPNRGPTAGL